MASLLTNAPRWIESALVHASSDEVFRNADGPDGGTKTNDGDDDGSDAHLLDSQYDAEPQTENTIPSGLLPSPEKDDDDVGGEAPSRRGRIAQVIRRGGDVAYYDAQDHNQTNDGAGGGRKTGKNKRKRMKRRAPCPPYLILHDGRHAAVAFLSPETLAASEGQLPPNKCLVSINQFAVSTIRQCAGGGDAHARIMSELYRDAALIPDEIQEQLRHQVPDRLFLCLYLQRPIHVLGAENQGLIGHPVDVHCSVPLRRALMQHRKEWGGGNDANSNDAGETNDACGNDGDIVYEKLLEKLEASHILCQLAAKERTAEKRARGEPVPHAQGSPRRGKKQYGRRHKKHTQQQEGGHDEAEDEDLVPDWPWESRLVDEHPENVDVQQQAVKEEEEDAQFNPMGEVLEGGPGRSSPGNVDDGREMAEEGHRDGSGSDADAQTGDGAPRGGANDAPPAAPGNVEELLDNFDGSEFPSQNSEEAEKLAGAAVGRGDDATGGEGSNVAVPIERGNVEELFDNFDDIEDILEDVASEAPSHRQDATLDRASDALDGGASGPSEEERNERESAADGDGGEPPANEKASNAKSPSPKKVQRSPRKGATADEVWDWMSAEGTAEEGGTQREAGGDQGASFVGIDDMMVDEEEDDDDDDNAGEAREEGGDADDEPLFTQPDDYREDDDDYDEEGFDPKSQIPLNTRKALPDAAGYSDNEGEDAGVQSQIPLSMRKAPPETLGQMAMRGESAEEDSRPESQSPKMSMKKSKQSGRGAKKGKSQPTERTDERGDYVESQLPLERKRPARVAISRQELDDSDGSSDDWMRVSRSRPQHDDDEDESSIDDPSESQMAAGEGSEESVPPSQSLKRQEPSRKLRSSPRGRRRGEREEDDEAQPSGKKQASARGDSHHVRFSIGPEDGQARRSKRSNKPASDTSKGDLRGEVTPNTDGSTHTKEKAKKNLKTSKEFDMGQFLKRAKRFI